MKKISPKKGEVAKEIAKTLAKVVGKGLAIGGGLAALGFGIAGCEITPVQTAPAVPAQIVTGVIVDSYEGNSVWQSGLKGTYYVVKQTNPPTGEQRLFYVDNQVASKYPSIKENVDITFSVGQTYQRYGAASIGQLISVGNENIR
ncbi:MAG: hypothetical protein LBK73_04695 [Treponema sp.]|jgi:hypothetical protein|nr:hypothetical protein [Treponema sp.]